MDSLRLCSLMQHDRFLLMPIKSIKAKVNSRVKPTTKKRRHRAWNKGKSIGQKSHFRPADVRSIARQLENRDRLRDMALLMTGIDTMLRASDLLALRVEDVQECAGKIRTHFNVRQQKTENGNLVRLSSAAREALSAWIEHARKWPGDFLFTRTQGDIDAPISREQYANLIKQWAELAGLDTDHYSTHSVRRTKPVLIYDQTHNIEAVRHLLGQKSIAATVAYLGIDKKKALKISERFDIL